MYSSKLQKYGNSLAVRLPKAILDLVELKENYPVEIRVHEGTLIIIPIKRWKTLTKKISEYQGDYKCSEWDTGQPVGEEEL